jgi:alpha-galactosidase
MPPTKIVVIGAGSASFGLNTLAALMRSQRLKGSHLALVDRNAKSLALVHKLAQRLNREWGGNFTITTHAHHRDALANANFVIVSIEVPPREALWKMDYEIPLKYGVRQPYAENGGPGGFAHAARNIGPILEIARDMETACPSAWFINFTNPMTRICDAVARYSKIKVVGLCHQIHMAYAMVAQVLAADLGLQADPEFINTAASIQTYPAQHRMMTQAHNVLDIKAAGLNHFTWVLDVRHKQTGQDLYPLFRERWAAYDPNFEPLTRRVFDAFGLLPVSGDEHLCEYLPWLSNPITKPWEKYQVDLYDWDLFAQLRTVGHEEIAKMGDGSATIDHLREADSEGALEIIEAIACADNHYHLAVNIPNRGYIANLPDGAMVEVPGLVSGSGVSGIGVGALPEGVAELLRRETTVSRLCVDAAATGNRQAALQCLLLDPVVDDLDLAQQILDEYLETYKEHLPQFFTPSPALPHL